MDNENVFAAADNIDGGMSANQVEQKSRTTMVNEAIKMLSPDDAQVITLFYKGEQTLDEIAPNHGKRIQCRQSATAPGTNKIEGKNGEAFSGGGEGYLNPHPPHPLKGGKDRVFKEQTFLKKIIVSDVQ